MSSPKWPILVALVGVAGFGYAGWKLWNVPVASDDPDAEVPYQSIDPDPGMRWGRVESREVPDYQSFPGRVQAHGEIEVRALPGQRLPVMKIHHEQGEQVAKDEPLITLGESSLRKDIEEAEKNGDTEKAERFRRYLDNLVITAPEDGIVSNIWTRLGDVPYDRGIPLMHLASLSSFAVVAPIPSEIMTASLPLGHEVDIRVEGFDTPFTGTVSRHGALGPEGQPIPSETDHIPVAFAMEGRAGLEQDMVAQVLVPHGTREIILVPRDAVEWREDVAVVRVAEDGEVLERTIKVAQDERGWRIENGHYVVEYGIAAGQGVLIPAAE